MEMTANFQHLGKLKSEYGTGLPQGFTSQCGIVADE